MDRQQIEQVVKAVLAGMAANSAPEPVTPPCGAGVFASLDDAVQAASVAQKALTSVAMRQKAVAAIRLAGE